MAFQSIGKTIRRKLRKSQPPSCENDNYSLIETLSLRMYKMLMTIKVGWTRFLE